ncbi:MAG: very short patch repair endonuclease [Candidatus Thiodiazotropha lotti]|nr:very short patch repair endonuclease [Candidatus Thiodiazotropha lotti]MCW4222560.1 very short patch repair endonuclease [Candidatus Thiodiazotropha lotti]
MNRHAVKASSEAASHRMSRTGQRDTSAEMRIRRLLHAAGLRYRVDYLVLNRPRRKADIAFTRIRVAVFIDGCYWHGCPEHGTWPKANARFWREKIETNRVRDLDTNTRLEAEGWRVIRVWEHEEPREVVKKIIDVVRARSLEQKRQQ